MFNRIPYNTIIAAKNLDSDAIREILDHFHPLIQSKSMFQTRSKNGQLEKQDDYDMQEMIKAKLLIMILLRFDPEKIPKKKQK